MLIGGGVAILALLWGLWYAFLAPRGGTVDPKLAQKARELRQREKTVGGPPGASPGQ
jgi:hypothetical protein